jgi:N-carbamoylputrescine amidase
LTGRPHWLLGHVGPLSSEIPKRVAQDLRVPVVFANQCGETRTTIPLLHARIADRFAGQSSIHDGLHGTPARAGATEETVIVAPVTLHSARGPHACRSTSRSVHVAYSSTSARS